MVRWSEDRDQRYAKGGGNMHRPGVVGDEEITALDQSHKFPHRSLPGQV